MATMLFLPAAQSPPPSAPRIADPLAGLVAQLQIQIKDLEQRNTALQQRADEIAKSATDAINTAMAGVSDQTTKQQKTVETIASLEQKMLNKEGTDLTVLSVLLTAASIIIVIVTTLGTIFINNKVNSEVSKVQQEVAAELAAVRTAKKEAAETRDELIAYRNEAEDYMRKLDAVAGRMNAMAKEQTFAANFTADIGGHSGLADGATAQPRAADILALFPGKTPFDESFERGLIEQSNGNLLAAQRLFADAGAKAPDKLSEAKAIYAQAASLILSSRAAPGAKADDALPLLERVIAMRSQALAVPELEPLLARAQFLRAELLRQQGRNDNALAAYAWIVELFPEHPDRTVQQIIASALVMRGILLDQANQGKEALKQFDAVLARFSSPTDPLVKRQVAIASVNRGVLLSADDPRSADAAFATAFRLVEDTIDEVGRNIAARSLNGRADALTRLGHGDAAKKVRDIAVRRYGTDGQKGPDAA